MLRRAWVAAAAAMFLLAPLAPLGPTPAGAVIGGAPVSEGAYPFLALLLVQVSNGFAEYCGGALIAPQWVLTAAHCVTGDAPPKPDEILIGRMVASDTNVGDKNHAAQVFVDPAYDSNTVSHDAALIELTTPSPEKPAHLLDESQDSMVVPGTQGTVIGVGETQPNDPNSQPDTVQQVAQNVLTDAACAQQDGNAFQAPTMLCAGQPNQSPCFGDSGGPLFITGPAGPIEFGVVSHGPQQCGSAPGIYTRLAAERTWIRDTLASVAGPVTRVAGTDRIGTAIAVSNTSFPATGSAGAVVLSSAETFADALPGTPLAAAKKGPLLLTNSTSLDPRVAGEIQRVLPANQLVYILGGPNAVAASVDPQLRSLGFQVVRLAGNNRYATAVAIADQGLGNPSSILEATGLDFPDALAGGAAAAQDKAAVLLTDGPVQAPETRAYLDAHASDTRHALGGPAAAADPAATAIAGADRFATATMVASTFFPNAKVVGAASGLNFADALSGGAQMAALGGPMLLVSTSAPVAPSLVGFLQGLSTPPTSGFLYGGPGAVNPEVLGDLTLLVG